MAKKIVKFLFNFKKIFDTFTTKYFWLSKVEKGIKNRQHFFSVSRIFFPVEIFHMIMKCRLPRHAKFYHYTQTGKLFHLVIYYFWRENSNIFTLH